MNTNSHKTVSELNFFMATCFESRKLKIESVVLRTESWKHKSGCAGPEKWRESLKGKMF